MSFAALHKWVTYMIAGLGLASLFLGGALSIPAQLVITLGLIASVMVEGPRLHRPGWQQGWNVALLAVVGIQIVRGVLGASPLALALEVTAALQLSRLCNRRTATEHQQITILAFLHLCAATVLSTELAYGLAFVGFVIVAPWMLALTHLRSEIEGHYPGDPDPARAADVRRVLASKRVVGGSFLLGTAALSLPLFLMTAAVFVAFPRVGLGWLSLGAGSPTHVAGFGSDVELGQVGLVRDDPTVLLRVIPPGLDDPEATPPGRVALRMRGTSFDHYDGRRWSRTRRGVVPVQRYDDVYPIVRVPRSTDAIWQVMLDHLEDSVVFLPEGTVALEIPPRVQQGLDVGRALVIAPGLDVRYEDGDSLGLRYRARVSDDPRDALRRPITPEETRLALQVPEGHERVAALAREWTAGIEGDRARAERIEARLRALDYSLDMQDPGERPPLVAFLFDWRSGHCEYFSTAMAIMLRTLGIPTRNVTGFLGGRWNSFGRYYAIASGDAHSWVEVWIEGEGWQTFDPTPSGRGDDAREDALTSLAASIDAMLDALRTSWEDDVVGYDLRAQRTLAVRLARWLRSSSRSEPAVAAETPAPPPSGGAPWQALVAVAVAVIALALVARALRRRVGAERAAPIPPSAREAVALYQELERVLAARGAARPPTRTPREHAESLRAAGFAQSAAVAEITERYLEARFGAVPIPGPELRRLRDAIRTIARG